MKRRTGRAVTAETREKQQATIYNFAKRLEALPDPLRRHRSTDGLEKLWYKVQKAIMSPLVLDGLPPFAGRVALAFWTESDYVIDAVKRGDPAFFAAFQMRLEQIDAAAVSTGRSLAERSPIIRCKWILDGFRQAAEEGLRVNGGTWPPQVVAIDEPAPSDER